MVTSITYQNKQSANFLMKTSHPEVLGQHTIEDLEKIVNNYINFYDKFKGFIDDLKKENANVEDVFKFWFGKPSISIKTKRKRNYSLFGITVHEED